MINNLRSRARRLGVSYFRRRRSDGRGLGMGQHCPGHGGGEQDQELFMEAGSDHKIAAERAGLDSSNVNYVIKPPGDRKNAPANFAPQKCQPGREN